MRILNPFIHSSIFHLEVILINSSYQHTMTQIAKKWRTTNNLLNKNPIWDFSHSISIFIPRKNIFLLDIKGDSDSKYQSSWCQLCIHLRTEKLWNFFLLNELWNVSKSRFQEFDAYRNTWETKILQPSSYNHIDRRCIFSR